MKWIVKQNNLKYFLEVQRYCVYLYWKSDRITKLVYCISVKEPKIKKSLKNYKIKKIVNVLSSLLTSRQVVRDSS